LPTVLGRPSAPQLTLSLVDFPGQFEAELWGSKHLAQVQQITRQQLNHQFQEDYGEGASSDSQWIDDGTADPAQFGFNLSVDSLLLYWPPYAVGCWAWGGREVSVPFGKLNDVLKTEGSLGQFFNNARKR
jgi:hypothetical protein